jgi:hypothetical protein
VKIILDFCGDSRLKKDWHCDKDLEDYVTPWIARFLKGVTSERAAVAEACMYTMTPDHHFILDRLPGGVQSDKISHIDIQDDSVDTVSSHIDIPCPISMSRMTLSIWWMTISISDHILSLCCCVLMMYQCILTRSQA